MNAVALAVVSCQTVSKDFSKGIAASLALVTTDAKDGFYKVGSVDNLGKNGLVAGLKYSF